MMKKKDKFIVVVLTVVFSMMLVAVFGTFGYLIYQKSAGNQSQNQFKEDMEIVLNDSEQEKTDESMNEEEITENEDQITESDDHLQPTPEPQKTETPEKNQGKQRSKEEIREKFFKEFINNQGALQVTDDKGQIVIYNRFYPGISAEFTYEEAEAFLDASKSEQQKIKNKAEILLYFFTILATHSTCIVCGNISTGCISTHLYPLSSKYAKSLAKVDGLQDT